MPDAPALHDGLEPLAFLLGTWRGEGAGHYPTIDSFRYGEEARFGHSGKPVMSYLQRTWALGTGTPLHSESGFLRPAGDGALELVVAHGFGAVEIDLGTLEGRCITLSSTSVVTTPTAKRIDAVTRRIEVSGESLSYGIGMAAMGLVLQPHLGATLRRSG
jgi:THAP domain-containing protein 4